MLDAEFSTVISPAHHSEHKNRPKTATLSYPSPPPKQSYEERIRAYRERNRDDGATVSQAVQQRLSDYINEKTRRVLVGNQRDLSGAFTWKAEGARTVWVGLDFGTQNTKVAFRDGEMDDHSVLLETNPAAKGIARFMMAPSIGIHGKKLAFSLKHSADTPSWKHALSTYYGITYAADNKAIESWLGRAQCQCSLLSCRSHEELVIFFTSLHLAFILSQVGSLITDYYKNNDITDELAFRVFMCAPVAALEEQLSQLVFQDTLTIADQIHGLLDFDAGEVSLDEAVRAFDKVRNLGILVDQHICRRARVVPEVTAEIASYAQSRSAREGVYALVDVGAGTLDLNVFKIVHPTQKMGKTTPIYAAACHPNGVDHLESLLVAALGGAEVNGVPAFEKQKLKNNFPDVDDLARNSTGGKGYASDIRLDLEKAHATYCQDVAERTGKTWGRAWDRRGNERDPWSRITMFLCGGGSAVCNLKENLGSGMPGNVIKQITHSILPCPSEQEFVRPSDFPVEEFHRVAVAYGLTFGTNFEPYKLPSGLSKLQVCRETIDIEGRYISMDMV
jgi:hypothetical protein